MIRLARSIAPLFLFVLLTASGFSQEKSTISGFIKDAETGEELIGATVFVKELGTGTVTNVYGFYSLTLPNGTYNIDFTYVGFANKTQTIELNGNQKIDVELGTDAEVLKEFEVKSERGDENVKSVEMSVNKMEISTIKKIPAFLGEVDVIRSIQLLPGVSTVGEGASGFNVRGGGVDQNLVLLDEAPVYNSSHMFGFFSVFNPDAVKNVKLVKGGIPAQYGGRLSSLLDVRMKEGNQKRFSGSGGVGAIFSRLTLEAPIIKDKASFIVAGRRSYADVLARPFLTGDLSDSKLYFYDLTAKVNYKLNDNNRLFLSGYLGQDVFGFGDFQFDWGNQTATARWNHIFNDKVFMNVSGIYSKYDYQFGVGEASEDAFNWKSNIINYSVKPELTWYLNSNNTIIFGGQAIFHDFVPGSANFTSGGASNDISLQEQKALENAVYVGNEQKVGSRVVLKYGLRLSSYQYLGDATAYTLQEGDAGEESTIIDQTTFDQWEVIESYAFLEPRLAAKYDLNESSSIKASYNRTTQYLHLLSNTAAATPIDVWSPTTNNIKPQYADQVAIGYFRNFKGGTYETSIETYYKDLHRQYGYVNGASLLLNDFYETQLLEGKGRAYGLELYLKKSKGDFTGWISYTLSRSEQQIDGLNRDEWYPNRFDKPHNLSVVANYQLNERWSFSANFAYSTGTPSSFPTTGYQIQGWVIPHDPLARRNNFRIPDYHRLDFSATLDGKKKEGRRWHGQWVFSVYNAYGRRNAFSVYFQQNEDQPTITEAVRLSIIGSVVPSVAYNFNF